MITNKMLEVKACSVWNWSGFFFHAKISITYCMNSSSCLLHKPTNFSKYIFCLNLTVRRCSFENRNWSIDPCQLPEIFIILSFPGLDMFRLFMIRIFKGKNPFNPDRNHIHHLIQKRFNIFRRYFRTSI